MAKKYPADGIGALIHMTKDFTEFAIEPITKNVELLPYPDDIFTESTVGSYQQYDKFTIEHINSRRGQAFVFGLPVSVKSITVERATEHLTDLCNPNIYCIKVQHGSNEWMVRKRYCQFQDLHKALAKLVEKKMHDSRDNLEKSKDKINEGAYFPTRHDHITTFNDFHIEQRCSALAKYLNQLLKHPKFRQHQATYEFFEVSCLSFIRGLSASRKEGYLLIRPCKGRRNECGTSYDQRYSQKWVVVKDTFIVCIQPETNALHFPILVDRGFEVKSNLRRGTSHHHIQLSNLQVTVVLKCRTTRDFEKWKHDLTSLAEHSYGFMDRTANRFNSYAPIRENQLAYWFINGKPYMEAVAKALLAAREEVFITDWWLSPDIQLIRPAPNDTFRLDNVLGQIADTGVRVYIMIFKEPMAGALPLESALTKRILSEKSNKGFIKVIRHSRQVPQENSLFWSHHEKMVIIDQAIAFVGGIDLCYGRWEDECMRLVDSVEETDAISEVSLDIFTEDVMRESVTISESSQSTSVLPMTNDNNASGFGLAEDNGLSGFIKNTPLRGSARIRRRDKLMVPLQKIVTRMKKNHEGSDKDDATTDDQQSGMRTPSTLRSNRNSQLFPGKDYTNEYVTKGSEGVNRDSVPRTPWHDEALVVLGEAARDAARHFIQRWNIHKWEKYPKEESYPFLLPKPYEDLDNLETIEWQSFLKGVPFRVHAQCVRSVATWSAGTKTVESSIQNAYIQMINAAKHYIYIENQFFTSMIGDEKVRNGVADAIFRRIKRAYLEQTKFRIYVVIPLLPAFDNIRALEAVLYYSMRSISKGDNSLFRKLLREGITPDDYITFFGMRNHDILMGRPVSEIVYVHSKLMIVDDRIAICGSANINDRSLNGQRDSEFCFVITDAEEEYTEFNNARISVGKFCSSWRKSIFSMLLGIHIDNPNNIDVTDPVSENFYKYFKSVARKNTLIYEEVFPVLPTNRVTKRSQISEYRKTMEMRQMSLEKQQEKLKNIQGFVVDYPLYYLDEEDFVPSITNKEGMVPTALWT